MRGFGHVDLARRFAEVVLRRRFDAERAAAHVGAVEVEFENFAFGVAALKQERQKQFLDLALDRAFGRQEQVFGELLGQRRAALHDFVGLHVGCERAHRALDVDAVVFEEAPVFGGECGLDQGVGNFIERHAVVVQNAALAEFVAVDVEELDGELAGREFAFVEFEQGWQGGGVQHDERAGCERERFPTRLR